LAEKANSNQSLSIMDDANLTANISITHAVPRTMSVVRRNTNLK
jgi:hypothetical protein